METVFISYSWDSDEHQLRVFSFCKFLRESGFNAQVDALLSQQETAIDFFKMMHRSIAGAEKVIIVLSEGYRTKADAFTGGVGHEYALIIRDIDKHPNKYILVSFEGIGDAVTPFSFRGRDILDMSKPAAGKRLFAKLMDTPLFDFGEVAAQKPDIKTGAIPEFRTLFQQKIDAIDWKYYIPYYLETFDGGDSDADDFETYKNNLHAVWHPKSDVTWESKITGGRYRLINQLDPVAVRYIWVDAAEKNMAQSLVSVEVDFAGNFGKPLYGGGLMYLFDKETRYYYAFIINREKQFGFYLRHEGGFKPLFAGTNTLIRTDGVNKIAIASDGTQMNLYINEQLALNTSSIELKSGLPGIIAMGGGEFIFDNFSLYDMQ